MTQKIRQPLLAASSLDVDGDASIGGNTTISGNLTVTGDITQGGGEIILARQLWVPAALGVVGATAGWVTAEDGGLVRLPAAETASTFVIPIPGLHVGDTLQGVSVVAQVESAGNIATLALGVRKSTLAAADFADASLDTDASGDLTADTAISPDDTALEVAALAETLAVGEHVYALLTGTTAAATDIALAGLIVTYDQA